MIPKTHRTLLTKSRGLPSTPAHTSSTLALTAAAVAFALTGDGTSSLRHKRGLNGLPGIILDIDVHAVLQGIGRKSAMILLFKPSTHQSNGGEWPQTDLRHLQKTQQTDWPIPSPYFMQPAVVCLEACLKPPHAPPALVPERYPSPRCVCAMPGLTLGLRDSAFHLCAACTACATPTILAGTDVALVLLGLRLFLPCRGRLAVAAAVRFSA